MAINNNQHFVPKVHLQPFTLDGDNMAINLINIARLPGSGRSSFHQSKPFRADLPLVAGSKPDQQ